jgi:hypothetical protein
MPGRSGTPWPGRATSSTPSEIYAMELVRKYLPLAIAPIPRLRFNSFDKAGVQSAGSGWSQRSLGGRYR